MITKLIYVTNMSLLGLQYICRTSQQGANPELLQTSNLLILNLQPVFMCGIHKCGFPKMGLPQNGLFIMENPTKMDDLGVPHFRKPPNDFRCSLIVTSPVHNLLQSTNTAHSH